MCFRVHPNTSPHSIIYGHIFGFIVNLFNSFVCVFKVWAFACHGSEVKPSVDSALCLLIFHFQTEVYQATIRAQHCTQEEKVGTYEKLAPLQPLVTLNSQCHPEICCGCVMVVIWGARRWQKVLFLREQLSLEGKQTNPCVSRFTAGSFEASVLAVIIYQWHILF